MQTRADGGARPCGRHQPIEQLPFQRKGYAAEFWIEPEVAALPGVRREIIEFAEALRVLFRKQAAGIPDQPPAIMAQRFRDAQAERRRRGAGLAARARSRAAAGLAGDQRVNRAHQICHHADFLLPSPLLAIFDCGKLLCSTRVVSSRSSPRPSLS